MENKETHIHKFAQIDVPSTCKERGYTLYKCECGYEHKDHFKQLAPHSFKVVEEKKPTCTEGGFQKLYCSVCSETQVMQLAPLGHDWEPWAVEKFATCTEDGKKIRVCKRCGAKEEENIKAKGHKLSSPKKSATQKGMVEYYCESCGETILLPGNSKKFMLTLKKVLAIIAAVFVALNIVRFLGNKYIMPIYHYNVGKNAIQSEDYEKAYLHLYKCGQYKDSQELLKDFSVICDKEITTNIPEFTSTTYTCEYDEYDNKTSEIFYDEDGDLVWERIYTYDTVGNMTSKFFHDEEDGYYEEEDNYTYDEDGNLTSETHYGADGDLERKVKYTYDEDGDLISETRYDGDGDLDWKSKYTYDKDGNLTSETRYDEDGHLYLKVKYTYDKNGNLTSETHYDGDGDLVEEYKYTYDKDGNLTSETHYYAYGYLWERKCTYDKDGNLTYETHYSEDGDLVEEYTYKYTYDKDGNMTSQTCYGADGDLNWKSKYTYDIAGNRTSEIRYSKAYGLFIQRYKFNKYGQITLDLFIQISFDDFDFDFDKTKYVNTRVIYHPNN